MNLVLFEPDETVQVGPRRYTAALPGDDPRLLHLRKVVAIREDAEFDAGIIGRPRAKGCFRRADEGGFFVELREYGPRPSLPPVTLLLGACRPQTVKKILREATALGTGGFLFFTAEKSEAGYSRSRIYHPREARRYLKEGAAQAFSTALPGFTLSPSLEAALALLPAGIAGVALDNYEATGSLWADASATAPGLLAIGPERGWSAGERAMLRRAGFPLLSLGDRVLRSETAAIAGLTIFLGQLGLLT